jgi:hypothetical protein
MKPFSKVLGKNLTRRSTAIAGKDAGSRQKTVLSASRRGTAEFAKSNSARLAKAGF